MKTTSVGGFGGVRVCAVTELPGVSVSVRVSAKLQTDFMLSQALFLCDLAHALELRRICEYRDRPRDGDVDRKYQSNDFAVDLPKARRNLHQKSKHRQERNRECDLNRAVAHDAAAIHDERDQHHERERQRIDL